MKVIWMPKALANLADIGATIAWDHGIPVAEKWRDRIFGAAEQLESLPLIGAEVPEIGRNDIREVGFPPYRVIYRLRPDRCEILTVVHSRQSLSSDKL